MLTYLNNDVFIAIYLITPFVFGVFGYPLKISAIICLVGCIIIYNNTIYYGDHRDSQNINAGLIVFLLPLFWILHNVPFALNWLVAPIRQWIIERWTARK